MSRRACDLGQSWLAVAVAAAVLASLTTAGSVARAQAAADTSADVDGGAVAREADGPTSARARTAALSWVRLPGAEACPSTQDVARAVEERLARSVFVSAADAELTVEGRIERVDVGEPGAFRATLTVADASGASLGERVLEHAALGDEGCAGILPALALTIALTIDPDALAVGREPEPELVPDPAVDATAVEPTAPPANPWRFEITSSLLGALGLSPTATLGGALTLALTPPGFVPIFVHGALAPWSRAEPTMSQPVDVLQTYVGLGICPLAFRETAPVSLFACAGVDVGALVALSARETLTEPERITVQADVSFGLHVGIAGPLYAALAAALLVPFRGEPLFLRGPPARAWFDPEPVAGVLTLGLGADLEL